MTIRQQGETYIRKQVNMRLDAVANIVSLRHIYLVDMSVDIIKPFEKLFEIKFRCEPVQEM